MKDKLAKQAGKFNYYRLRMTAFMLLADLTGFLVSNWLAHVILVGYVNYIPYASREIEHAIIFLISFSLFVSSKLYPGVGINPANEIKLVIQYTFISMTIGLAFSTTLQQFQNQHLWISLLGWVLSFTFVLFSRWSIRIFAVQAGIWEEPVLVIANGEYVNYLVDYFHKRLRLGFCPVLVASDDEGIAAYTCSDPIIHMRDLAKHVDRLSELGIETALIDFDAAQDAFALRSNRAVFQTLPRLIYISNLDWVGGLSLNVHDFEGMVAMEAHKNTLSPFIMGVKFLSDALLASLIFIALLPILGLVTLLIKLDSAGPIFYLQERIGRDGKKLKIYKFRSMVQNADQILAEYLEKHPELQTQWNNHQKLYNDPRITRVGRWLRKFSIDELPQIINVLRGEMSMIGPRPITPEQVGLYGERIETYYSMRPGISGLWQVSGRNKVTFNERSRFDVYYVRHWSIWLDIYILLRTIWVVVFQVGAY